MHFDGVHAVDGIDLIIHEGEILGLIGPNGAGKTTLVNALSGFQRPSEGRISLFGTDVTRLPPHRLARRGLVRTFQSVRLFPRLSVLENVEVSAVGAGMRRREARRWATEILQRLGLGHRLDGPAAGLPQGEERRVGIVRALAMKPKFLLLDEPAAGLNEGESAALVESLAAVRQDFECGLMVIEHDMSVIMRLCERIQVLDYGKTISVGTPDEVRADPAVIAAYLGTARESSRA